MSNAFREQLSSWRNSANMVSHEPAEQPGFFARLRGYTPLSSSPQLPITERVRESDTYEEPGWFTLSRWDRLLVFGVCLLGAVFLFTLCFLLLPVVALKPRKFATLWSLASLLFVISFGVLQGPVNYIVHLVSPSRVFFTIAYFGSILATLVFSLGLQSTLLTLLAVILQVVAAIWYTVSYFPMGTESLKFASRVGARQVTSWINA